MSPLQLPKRGRFPLQIMWLGRETDYPSQSSAWVKNKWRRTSSFLYACLAYTEIALPAVRVTFEVNFFFSVTLVSAIEGGKEAEGV